MTWFQQEIDRSEQRGGRRLLLKQLRLRFGDLPAAIVARIEAADLPELEAFAERLLTAPRPEDVIDPPA